MCDALSRHNLVRILTRRDRRIKELKGTLREAILIIKAWHRVVHGQNVVHGEENAEFLWKIYFNDSPEMKSLQKALGGK